MQSYKRATTQNAMYESNYKLIYSFPCYCSQKNSLRPRQETIIYEAFCRAEA